MPNTLIVDMTPSRTIGPPVRVTGYAYDDGTTQVILDTGAATVVLYPDVDGIDAIVKGLLKLGNAGRRHAAAARGETE